jgi:hypothetical protein
MTDMFKLVMFIMFRAIYRLFFNYLAGILLAEPSNYHHPTSNQIEPVHLFLSLITLHPPLVIPSPQRTAIEGGSTQNANMKYVKHIIFLKVSHKIHV